MTITIEFKASSATHTSDGVLWGYGHSQANQMNALNLLCTTSPYGMPPHMNWFWYGDDLIWYFESESGMPAASQICDDQWHTVTLKWDGSFKSLWFDGVQRKSGAPTVASHSSDNTNFCLGGEIARGGLAFTGSIRNFQIFGDGATPAACLVTYSTPPPAPPASPAPPPLNCPGGQYTDVAGCPCTTYTKCASVCCQPSSGSGCVSANGFCT